jgi:hypothetical protein
MHTLDWWWRAQSAERARELRWCVGVPRWCGECSLLFSCFPLGGCKTLATSFKEVRARVPTAFFFLSTFLCLSLC